jgi:hypothetical protein
VFVYGPPESDANTPTNFLCFMSIEMASVEIYAKSILDGITQVFFKILSAIQVDPAVYYFLFPDSLSLENVKSLIDEGVFPTIASLAPAFTYALLLSIARFFLQRYLVKVSENSQLLIPTKLMNVIAATRRVLYAN